MKCFVCGKRTTKTHKRRVWEYGKEWIVCSGCFRDIPAEDLDEMIRELAMEGKEAFDEEEILPPCTC